MQVSAIQTNHNQYIQNIEIKDRSLLPIIKKITVIAVAILLSPLIFSAVILVGIAHCIDKLCAMARPSSFMKKMEKMKQAEDKTVFHALQEIAKSKQFDASAIRCPRNSKQLAVEKFKRHLLRIAALDGRQPISQINEKIRGLNSATKLKEFATSTLGVSQAEWKKIHAVVDLELKAASTKKNALNAENAFKNGIQQLFHVLDGTPKHYGKTNKQVIVLLRELLVSDYYKLKKEDPQDPAIAFLHSLAAGMWMNVKPMEHYRKMGSAIVSADPSPALDDDPSQRLYRSFKKSQKTANKVFPKMDTLSQK